MSNVLNIHVQRLSQTSNYMQHISFRDISRRPGPTKKIQKISGYCNLVISQLLITN